MRLQLLAFALIAVSPAAAQTAGGCSGFKWPIDREQSAFAGDGIPTVTSGGQIPGVMAAAALALSPQEGLSYPVPPVHKPRNVPAYGGVFALAPMAAEGTYQVTLSEGAWIDVVQNGTLLKQTGFTDSKDCHDVRKSVRFRLAAGPATIEISDASKQSMKIDVLPPSP